MFNLEQSIVEWRQKMLATGIKTPVPLEELETHLREEIEEQIKSGVSEQGAFEFAVQQIGRADFLKAEFRNAGFLNSWSEKTQRRINRIFALVWLAYCTVNFFFLAEKLSMLYYQTTWPVALRLNVMLAVLLEVILLRIIVASIRVFGGNNKEVRILHFAAIMALAALMPQIIFSKMGVLIGYVCVAFNVLSLVLLRSPSRKNPDTATK